MLSSLTVDGVNLTTFGAYIFDRNTRNAPEKQHTFYTVPGRDGAVLSPIYQLKNVEVDYYFVITSNVDTNLGNLRSFLLSRRGYVRIVDSQYSDEFRMGVFEGPIKVKATIDRDMAKGVITFNCQPQRWLTSGETMADISLATSMATVENSTYFSAKPIIRFYGYGTATFYQGSSANASKRYSLKVEQSSYTYIDFDCETMNAYYDSTNLNNMIRFTVINQSAEYQYNTPVLFPGNTLIERTGATPGTTSNFTRIAIEPRWWRL